MKTYSRVLFLLLVLFAAIPWFVLWQRQGEIGRLRTTLDALEKTTAAERRSATERTRTLEDQLRKQGQELEESRATVGATTLKPAEGPSFDAAIALPFGPKEREEMQRLHALHERAALETRFAGLFKKLKLSPEKLERFKTLLVERELSAADAMMAAHEQGLAGPHLDPAAAQKLMAQAQGTVDRSLAELLGAEDYARYDEYQRTLAQRALVEQLEKRLSYTDQPLSESQAQQLVNLLSATANSTVGANGPELHNDAVFIGSTAGGPVHSFGGPTISDEALSQAQSMLSAAQLAALRDLQALQRAQRESMRTLPVPGGLRVSAPIGVSPPR